ncbi:hypothetical protein TrLO_g8467 [Triparma laevis f. longispina]|uniref:Uncharacterized protein n=1 Tax=Triparma laevis f. longispina TaxID=1714387 RepID=A0A9W7F3T4_9STRA|nr:hypothetical protein TrLO_g8467 [Triparma laevis f. longispina]
MSSSSQPPSPTQLPPSSSPTTSNSNSDNDTSTPPPLIPAVLILFTQITSFTLSLITLSSVTFLLLLSGLFVLPISRPAHSRIISSIQSLLLSSLSLSLPSTPLHLTNHSSPLGNIGRNIVVCNFTSCRDVFLLLILIRYLVGSEVRVLGNFQQKNPTDVNDGNKYFSKEYYLGVLSYLLDLPLLSPTRQEMTKTLDGLPADVTLLIFPEGLNRPPPSLEKHYASTSNRKTFTNLGLPRTKGFNTLMSILHSSPSSSIYSLTLCTSSLLRRTFSWSETLHDVKQLLRGQAKTEILVDIKNFTLETGARTNFLDDRWADKDRFITKYLRGEIREYRTFDSRYYNVLTGLISLGRLTAILVTSPIIVLCVFPIGWCTVWFYILREVFRMYLGDRRRSLNRRETEEIQGYEDEDRTRSTRTESNFTPYFPSTPFASPLSLGGWGRKETKEE